MCRTVPGAKPAPLNVVAVVYRWGVGRTARTKVNSPLDIEARLGTSRRGKPWPRLAVPFIFRLRILEILAFTVLPGALVIILSRATAAAAPAVSAVLDLAGTVVAMFPVALLAVVGVWCLLPERRTGGYLRHPERLWGPSIATLLVAGLLGFLIWDAIPLSG
jgi:hypothetical protein